MITETITYVGELTVTSCHCGIRLAVPQSLYRKAQSTDNFTIFCPLGHRFVYSKNRAQQAEEEAQRLRSELEWANRRAANAIDRERVVQRRLAAAKGQQTKLKNRIAKGVCPCCNRSFVNLERHMTGQHPDFASGVSS